MLNREIQSDRKNKNIIGMMQSCLILILVVLIIMIMVQDYQVTGDCACDQLCRSGAWSHAAHGEIRNYRKPER